jgi:hypothetical protein
MLKNTSAIIHKGTPTVKKLQFSLVTVLSVFCVGLAETSWGRGFGGMHGGVHLGGMHGMPGGMRPGGMRPGGMAGGMRPGGMPGGMRPGGMPGGMRPGGMAGGMRPGGNLGGSFGGVRPGGNLGSNFGGVRPGGNFGGSGLGGNKGFGGLGQAGGNKGFGGLGQAGGAGFGSRGFPGESTGPFGSKGLGGTGFGGTGFGGKGLASKEGLGGKQGLDSALAGTAKRPDRSQLGNFLGLPSDGGLHKVAGDQAGKDRLRADQARGNDVAGNQLRRDDVAGDQMRRDDVAGNQLRRDQVGRDAQGMRRYSAEDLRNRGDYVRRDFDGAGYYSRDWYARYPGAWYTSDWADDDLWAAMDWDSMDDYFGYGDTEPEYYDYGNTVTYQDNSVYMNGQDMGTSDEYYQQAQDLADTGAQAQVAADVKWMPLGVFAMTHGDQSKANLVLQLAVNKDGTIRGNYTATLTNDTKPIQGSVDKKTQRAAWTIGDNKDNVIETGIYNLTKDEAPCLVHFGKDKTQQWLLVRLNKDGQDGSKSDGSQGDGSQGDGSKGDGSQPPSQTQGSPTK